MDVSSLKRLEWIDWMKALGIYLIVLGHFYSIGEKFIYVFHVPLFFVISGILCKKESDSHLFWRKLWYNLAVPMLIMSVLNFLCYCIHKLSHGTFEPIYIYWFVRDLLVGMESAYDSLWFVYTLILLKIIYQFCSSKRLFYVLIVVMLAFAYIYNHVDRLGYPFFLKEPNCFFNVFTAYPFFALGLFTRDYKTMLHEWTNKGTLVCAFIGGLLLVISSCYFNDKVDMFSCGYGGNMLWFLTGAIAGTMMIFAASKLLGHAPKLVTVISRGTIVILGFHKLLIFRGFMTTPYLDIVYAALIVILFIPVILAIERYCPLMIGKYRIRKNPEN